MSSNTILDSNRSSTPSSEPFDPYLASLPLELAFQVMAARYITVGSLAIFIWEILINICNDCNLLFEHRLRLPTVVYFISRLCCLGFTISAVVIRLISVLPNSTCFILERLVVTFYCAAVVFSSLLFFFRTRALFNTYPWVVAFFAGLWLAVLGGCVAFIVDIFEPIPDSKSNIPPICIKPGMGSFVAASTIIPLINDTLVFLAISWRLSRNSYDPYTLESGIRLLIFGDYLPVFSKALLQDGQAYYMTIVTMNIVSVIMLFYPSNPEILRTIFTVPNVVLMNVMACRVFRNTKLFGAWSESEVSTSLLYQDI